MFVYVWDHSNKDRSPYNRDGFHFNRYGKARLNRLSDEGVKKVTRKEDKGKKWKFHQA